MEKENISSVIEDVERETERFMSRLKAAKLRFSEDKWACRCSKESASLRRSALDLKNELTRITQSTGY